MSRPVFLPHSENMTVGKETGPTLKVKGLWHPFALGENGGLPVPNDIILGKDIDGYHARTLLLTGPNMGGKSTLLRATCLAVILAQVLFLPLGNLFCCLRPTNELTSYILNPLMFCLRSSYLHLLICNDLQLGCYVPCELCVLSLVDIIFTRLGATDRIMTGESKFSLAPKRKI